MLKKGYGKKTIGKNIGTEIAAGKEPKVAEAIAFDVARRAAKKAGKPSKVTPAPKKTAKKGQKK